MLSSWGGFLPCLLPQHIPWLFTFQNQQAFPWGLTQEALNMVYLKPINRLTQTLRCLGRGLFMYDTHRLLPHLSQEGHHFTSLII